MSKKDLNIDYDPRQEQDLAPDQYAGDAMEDDLDLEELKRLTSDDYSYDSGEDPYAGDIGYDSNGREEPDLYDDAFIDQDLDNPAPFDDPRADYSREAQPEEMHYEDEPYDEAAYEEASYGRSAAGLPGEDELLRRTPGAEEIPYEELAPGQEEYPQEEYPQEEYPQEEYPQEEFDSYPEEEGDSGEPRPKKAKKPRKPIQLPKLTIPPFFHNFMALYFGAAIAELTGMNKQEGRRRKSKIRIFKEAYLPPLILLVTLILIISTIVGSISTAVNKKLVKDEAARQESVAAAEEEDRLQGEYVQLMDKADAYAAQYDYDKAIEVLDSYSGNPPQDMLTKRAEFATQATRLVEWKDPAGIPNLSFHVLVADPARAYADKKLGGKYNMNFVTTDEFQRILDSLYANNYVLVDFDCFVETSQGIDGPETFALKPLMLPEDKKPVMITETLVSYYDYMIDGDDDGKPDAQGAGFASRLVVDANGDIKAEMVDASGKTVVGDYDLVPILETFLKTHPDFSYRGSRAILAPSGEQGIFGYRIQTAVRSDPKLGQDYYNQQVQGAKDLVAALREKGYTMASYTYANRSYGQDNANQISEDLQRWDTQITPVIGNTDIIVFAQGSDIGDYTGTKYKALYEKGFRFFIGKADKPFVDVTNSYVRQKRLMVTGSNMFWNGKMFAGLFEPAAILNSMRGDVPKAK